MFPQESEEDDIVIVEGTQKNLNAIIKERNKTESAERMLDMINPANSHPQHLSPEDFFQ